MGRHVFVKSPKRWSDCDAAMLVFGLVGTPVTGGRVTALDMEVDINGYKHCRMQSLPCHVRVEGLFIRIQKVPAWC